MKNFLLVLIVIFISFAILISAPQLEWSTYLGGNSREYFGGFKVDKNGNSFIATNLFSLNGEKIIQESEMNGAPGDGDRLILISLLAGG